MGKESSKTVRVYEEKRDVKKYEKEQETGLYYNWQLIENWDP
jgi:hypothetical protein